MQTRDVGLAVATDDSWFRPVDIKLGPDGALYIADWYDRPDQPLPQPPGTDRTGRWAHLPARPLAMPVPSVKPLDLSRLSTLELVERLADPNKWTRQTALRLIGDRKDTSIVPELSAWSAGNRANCPRGLWALNLSAGWMKRRP